MGSASKDLQRQLISPLEEGSVKGMRTYRLKSPSAKPYLDIEAKTGAHALQFSAEAGTGGGKGDFIIAQNPQGTFEALGMWVYLTPESNVGKVGIQIYDSEGESFFALQDAYWDGWEWVEFNLGDDGEEGFRHAYRQNDKSGEIEFPLKSINIVWFVGREGPSSLGVDALTALSKVTETPRFPLKVEVISDSWTEPGKPVQGQALIHNFSDQSLKLKVVSSVQLNSNFETPKVPDPVMGSNHAVGKPSWLMVRNERKNENALTDEDPSTFYRYSGPKGESPPTEIFEFVDLGESRLITHIQWRAADANWVRMLDIYGSENGDDYTPIEGLQNMNIQKKWGIQTVELPKPTSARYLRLRHSNGDDVLPGHFRAMGSLMVYDGPTDEAFTIPSVGKEITTQETQLTIAPKSYDLVTFKESQPLKPGAYLFGLAVDSDGYRCVDVSGFFVMPETEIKPSPDSRFGINSSGLKMLPFLVRAGFGWVRFENLKWQFYNPSENDFRFDGSVKPWVVPFDALFEAYQEAGISILPFIFQTPKWATSAPEDVTKNRDRYLPKDLNSYKKAIFQAVARYSAAEVAEEKLLTPDQRTGLNLITSYELWNEQNLNAPSWGFFVGTLDEFYPLYRAGVEGVKEADPSARILNGGWAGIDVNVIDTMATFKYPDGKTPLDLTDVLSAHFYTGKSDPETATDDPNARRTGKPSENSPTLEMKLQDLSHWRNRVKKEMPIWITEMGYDVDGPMGLDERYQAAKLPRAIMIAFANGVEKLFIYRETGSGGTQHTGAGLARNDLSLRPSYFTIATLIRQFEGVTQTAVPRLETNDPNVWMYYWERPSGNLLTAWVPQGEGKLGLDLGRCLVTDAFGMETEMEVTKDFPLSIFPTYISKVGNLAPITTLQNKATERVALQERRRDFERSAETYLFDFGADEYIGTQYIGKIRTFTPILIDEEYDEEKGYGFTTGCHGKNIITIWKKTPLEKDAIQFNRPVTFSIMVKPGSYLFQLQGEGFDEGSEITIDGASVETVAIPLKPGRGIPPTKEYPVTIESEGILDITMPRGRIDWITLVQAFEE